MILRRHILILIIIYCLIVSNLSANSVYDCIVPRKISESQIKTIQIYRTGSELSDPIIELGKEESITLSFDDLSDNPNTFSYSIKHCTKDWKESNLALSEYMDGFEINQLSNFTSSTGTTVPYTHYQVQIPNNDVKIKLSGNYLIRIFDTYNPETIFLEEKFMVVENLFTINAKVRQPIDGSKRLTSQQIELKINTNSTKVSDPYSEITPLITQNNQPDNSLSVIKPVFIQANEIGYTLPDNLIFDGINEYRFFDINSIRYNSTGIMSIDQNSDGFNVQLSPGQNNRKTKYTSLNDINGKYKIQLEHSELSDIEADYVWVYFSLPYYDQIADKEVYVYGELSNWKCNSESLMQYSFQRQAYELRLKLKQGFYNYRFVVRDTKTGAIDQIFFEGNHFETENSYQILVYYRQIGKLYDRLVGSKMINSRNPN